MHTVNAHDAQIPALGFGTFELDNITARKMVGAALQIGYRHIDTAQIYKNEQAVGQGIVDSGVSRADIFLTTKVWVSRFSEDQLAKSVTESLDRLGTDYVDLLLLHWPNPNIPLSETIPAINAVKNSGQARNIGISNFTTALINEAVSLSDSLLVTNQVEYHPLLNQDKVLSCLRQHGMSLTAYSPLAQGEVFGNPTLKSIGDQHHKNPGQIALRWLIQQDGVIAIPRTANEAHARDNFDIFDFELSSCEMAEIDRLTHRNYRTIDPGSLAPDWD